MKCIWFAKTGLSILTIFFLLGSCGPNKSIKVKGVFSNAAGKTIYMQELTSLDAVTADTTVIDADGSFLLKCKNSKPAFYSLSLSNKNKITLAIYPGERITVGGDGNDLGHTYTVAGSPDSELAKQLNDKLNETLSKIDGLRKIYVDSAHSQNILAIRSRLDSTYNKIEADHQLFTKAFIRTNQHSLAALMALYQNLNPRRTVLNPTEHYELFQLVDSVLMSSIPAADPVQSLHNMLKDVDIKRKEQFETEKRTAIGAMVPEIALESNTGAIIKLSSLQKKYVLLDFWASWCEPCRKENPNLVRNYWRYKYAGFEIFQVSLDKSKESWNNAIKTDGLYWTHVSDLKMWNSPLVPLFGVQQIPMNFLINPEGKIIAKNLFGNDLAVKMKEIFKY